MQENSETGSFDQKVKIFDFYAHGFHCMYGKLGLYAVGSVALWIYHSSVQYMSW